MTRNLSTLRALPGNFSHSRDALCPRTTGAKIQRGHWRHSRAKRPAILAAWGLWAGLAACCCAQTATQPMDKVLAIVDENVVLQSEFDLRWDQVQQQMAALDQPMPPLAQLREQVLEQLILENLQLQMAGRAGIRVDDNQLNQAMTNIAAQNGMDFDEFRQILESQNLYVQTREQLRQDIILNQFQSAAVNQRLSVTRQEIENYLRSEAGIADIAPEYRVAHILIENGPQQERREELADFLHQQLADGENILELVAAGQISGIAISGGDLGWNKAEALPSLFAELAPNLEVGEAAAPFASSSGLHLVQLLEIRGGADLQLQQYHVRHILIQPNEIRTEEQAEALIHELHQRIQEGEDFADLARQHTDDASSIVAGGDLDWIMPGQYPSEFIAIVEAAPLEEMLAPARTESGWHIIEVLDTRLADMTEENKRFQAEQLLRSRKFENELQNWLTEIRDTAYIDIKTE